MDLLNLMRSLRAGFLQPTGTLRRGSDAQQSSTRSIALPSATELSFVNGLQIRKIFNIGCKTTRFPIWQNPPSFAKAAPHTRCPHHAEANSPQPGQGGGGE